MLVTDEYNKNKTCSSCKNVDFCKHYDEVNTVIHKIVDFLDEDTCPGCLCINFSCKNYTSGVNIRNGFGNQ
jgi:hypothetical protein